MENQNSVCFVAQIGEIKPIEGADNIELGIIQGWNCIIKKGSYQVGDLVVVATTDAVIPQELSDALNITNYLRKGQRVKTVKLRGVYSECLIIPIEFAKRATGYSTTKWNEGDDLMDTLKIYKYEPPVVQIQLSSGRKIRYHQNPLFQVYYKFPNLKNVKGMFTEDDDVEITRKIHGTNARYGIVRKHKVPVWDKIRKFITKTTGVGKETWKWIDYEFIYGSHNVEKGSDSQGFYDIDVWRTVADKYQIKDKLWEYFKNRKETHGIEDGVIIYGEIYGPGIQKNYDYGLKELTFTGFDIIIDNQYMATPVSELTFKGVLDLPYVPVLYKGQWSQEIQDSFVFNNFVEGTKIPHEGIVIKHVSGDRHKAAKVINPDYLIYGEKHNVGDSH